MKCECCQDEVTILNTIKLTTGSIEICNSCYIEVVIKNEKKD